MWRWNDCIWFFFVFFASSFFSLFIFTVPFQMDRNEDNINGESAVHIIPGDVQFYWLRIQRKEEKIKGEFPVYIIPCFVSRPYCFFCIHTFLVFSVSLALYRHEEKIKESFQLILFRVFFLLHTVLFAFSVSLHSVCLISLFTGRKRQDEMRVSSLHFSPSLLLAHSLFPVECWFPRSLHRLFFSQ